MVKANTLAQLICSRVRTEIFRILFGPGAGELHLREIQRQSGFAIGTVRQDIEKLVKIGVVIRRQDGNRVYYTANESHPLYVEIRQLVLKTVGMVDILAALLRIDEIRCETAERYPGRPDEDPIAQENHEALWYGTLNRSCSRTGFRPIREIMVLPSIL
jgi:DNA-binding transcriptional ArsR family regulator